MSAGWKTATVGESIVPVSVAGKSKIQTKDYKHEGAYPIVDQGQTPIAGWTDSLDAVIDAPLPLIVFGDHSRTFKHLDRPFARGADGTQLLRPVDEIDPLFFFYACRAIDLPSRGYNRHFTLLKEKTFSYPGDGAVQRSIAALLSRVERALLIQDELVALLKQAKAAAMRQLFSRGLRGEAQKETEIGPIPEGWELATIDKHFSVASGGTPSRSTPSYWVSGTIPWVKTTEVNYAVITETEEHITQAGLDGSAAKMLRPGTLLMAMYGQGVTRGKVGILGIEAACNQACAAMTPVDDGVLPSYLYHHLTSQYEAIRSLAHGGQQQNLNLDIVRKIGVPVPPTIDEQQEIVDLLDALDRKIDLRRRKREVLDQLFKSLLNKLMNGEVSVEHLDLSALRTTEGSAA
ncbi:restriction endonuclease subunit S [Cellulosimicrobium arenosum]|uniref:Restriction endonuclease subunit S n=1 Tax=Cellulosimicrobium arenosum TaxID=2708133 RepID=A0A927G7L8_9MICO|nr:restriction endonuclease subunit S [Cellulosimicrobium arenosum]MBD8078213.1 restriction endonuclease subunit S [Cellulosimicrobium arenosum]